ncbi:MAG: fumarate hydratase [Anaerolineaceae bacterium 4572_5.2]|nr:MAG: fumarate hydratase [Anaerolineaceae bacterium 4572_5.2]
MQPDLTEQFLELVRLTSTDLPADVEKSIREAREREENGSAAQGALDTVLNNVEMARENSTPICQDTGTPIFYVSHPQGWSTRELRKQIVNAVIEATKRTYLRPNSVNAITGLNTKNNTGDEHYPTIHFKEVDGDKLIADLMLKGGGCENVGAQYKLPNAKLEAGRDLEGVRKVALDAVYNCQGKGCAPGTLGIAIGGDRGSSFVASKEALFRSLNDTNPDPVLAELEERITEQANQLDIGPMGFGGKTTILGTKIKGLHRLPACYFVSVSYMCWAYRRRRMFIENNETTYA